MTNKKIKKTRGLILHINFGKCVQLFSQQNLMPGVNIILFISPDIVEILQGCDTEIFQGWKGSQVMSLHYIVH